MKVEYLQCDVCGAKIKHDESYRKIHHVVPVFNMDEPEHICCECFRKMKKWIEAQKEGAKGR